MSMDWSEQRRPKAWRSIWIGCLLWAVDCFLGASAIAQQPGPRVIPELEATLDAGLVPTSAGNTTIAISFPGTDAAAWENQILLAQQLSQKKYRILLRFPGPSQGFADYEAFHRLAASIPKVSLAIGDAEDGCVFGAPDMPVDTAGLLADRSQFSFAVKSLSVACREGNHDARVYLGFFTSTSLSTFFPIMEETSLAAYVDGYLSSPQETANFRTHILERHPAAILLSSESPSNGAVPFITNVFSAFQQSRLSPIIPTDIDGLNLSIRLQRILRDTASPNSEWSRSPQFLDEQGKKQEAFQFSSFSDYERRMEYVAITPPESIKSFLAVPSDDVSDPVLYDIVSEKEYPLQVTSPPNSGVSYVGLPGMKWPMLLYYKRFSKEHLETNEVTETFDLPLEIIMARLQAVENRQKELLHHYLAEARIEYHFRLPSGFAVVDVAFDNDFFFEDASGQEWRQNKMYVNGVPWKGKKMPKLPIPEPEKVVTLPLNLTLDKDYRYSLKGSDTINGRQAWRIEFEPAVTGKSLYSGKVWVDKKTFQRLRVSATQTGLEAPITSNDETTDFVQVEVGGQVYNIIGSVRGQQLFSAGGRQVFSERKINFKNIRINTEDFATLRNSAYKSNDVMLRDTPKGLRYLKKDPQGNRVVEMEPDTRSKFWLLGGFYNQSANLTLPFGGLNLLNYNWRKNGSQLNLLIAGALNVVSLSDPEFLRKNMDARLEAALFTVPLLDPFYNEGVRDKTQDVSLFREFGNTGIGFRLGQYGKITAGLQFAALFFLDTNDTSDDFLMPSNHLDVAPFLELNYTRGGLALSSTASSHYRSNWEPWGLPDSSDRVDPKKDYLQYQASVGKTFYPADFEKLGISLSYFGGTNLDRFSTYQFFYLGDVSLAGFSGSGLLFDKGALLKSFYQFDFFGVVRIGGRVEYARLHPLDIDRWDNHIGIGTDGNVFGPWDSLINYDIGYSIYSDVHAVQNKFTFSIMFLKLF